MILHFHFKSTPSLWSELARGGSVSQVATWVSEDTRARSMIDSFPDGAVCVQLFTTWVRENACWILKCNEKEKEDKRLIDHHETSLL